MLSFKIIGSGKTLVFLHGYLESLKIWLPIIQELKNHFQCLLIDFPGHGKSCIKDPVSEMEVLAVEIIKILDYLKIPKAIIIGHSMGGYVTLALADLYADRLYGFALINSSSLPDSEQKKATRTKTIESIEKNMNGIIDLSFPSLFSSKFRNESDEIVSYLKLFAKETSVPGAQAALRGMMVRKDRTNVFNKFSNPILIISGDEDNAIDVNLFHERVPEKENITKILLNSGHMSYIENKEQVMKLLQTFLSNIKYQ